MTESTIPIQNIYFILSYAWKQLDEAGRLHVNASDYFQYIDLFAKVLNNCCTYIFKRGLDREYKCEQDDLEIIRGKINFNDSIKNLIKRTPRLNCEYDELSNDNLHNQIIKAIIKKVLKVKHLDINIRYDLNEMFKKMARISDITLTSEHFKRVRLHRNNLFYRFVLNVSFLIHENIVLDEKTGEYEFVDFIRDEKKMADIFENFIRNFYKENLKGHGYLVKPEIINWDVKESDQVSIDFLPEMKTDISITTPQRKIIIDTKYYKECFQGRFDKKKIISSHLYQIIEYCENSDAQWGHLQKSEGMLLYPAVNYEDPITYPNLRGRKVNVRFINLNQDWHRISNDLLSYIN